METIDENGRGASLKANGFLAQLYCLIDRIQQFIIRLVYPYLRRKDAGYIANILAEYGRLRISENGVDKLANKAEVEGHYHALCEPDDAVVCEASSNYSSKVWLQNYMRQIFTLETAVFDMQDFRTLIARTPLLLARHEKTAGAAGAPVQAAYAPYLADHQLKEYLSGWEAEKDEMKRKNIEVNLRSRLQMLLNDVHWWYAQSQVREELFLGQQIIVIVSFIFVSLLLMGIYLWMCGNCSHHAVVLGMFFGMLGAFTSIMRRMRNDAEQHGGGAESSYKELTALAYGKVGIVFGLFFGIIFSLVLMLVFTSGITQTIFGNGMLFPKLPLACETGACTTGQFCLFDLSPTSANEFGKLMLWTFISGFAEKFVPDALDRLTRLANAPKSK